MKRSLLAAFILCLGLSACSNDDKKANSTEGLPSYMNITVILPAGSGSRAPGDNVTSNEDGTYAGDDLIKTLDVYMQSGNGDIERQRFEGTEIAISQTGTGAPIASPNEPFLTTSGSKTLFIVLNDTQDLGAAFAPGVADDLVSTDGLATIENGQDVIMMTGRSTIFVEPSVSMQQAAAGANRQDVDVTRVASRAIVTHTLVNLAFDNGNGITGTLSNLQYSVAQGTTMIYWLPPTGANIYNSYGYNYIPQINANGDVPYVGAQGASMYYDYSDLNTPSAIPEKPAAADGYKELKGKFLFENTHHYGTTRTTTGYRKGNTAYVLVRVTLTPDASAIADGGTLTAGTFYFGQADGKIYSSRAAAQAAVENQKVSTYRNGKMLYWAWLNPDDIDEPLNSPVIRNNIYHINIRSFSALGETWNPLYPEDPNTTNPANPDPKPTPDEPDSSIDPYDPLSVEETYMDIDATVLDWIVNSYNIDF